MDQGMQGASCSCGHHKVIPILVILLGLTFLLQALGVVGWYFVSVTWPILLIIAAIVKMAGRSCSCNMNHKA